jgi:hypothetical protein
MNELGSGSPLNATSSDAEGFDAQALDALAHIHHAYLLGLELAIATREGAAAAGEWAFRLFRRQHLEKFLSSFEKLGLNGLPHAVACAQYHVMSNSVGGVPVEYMYESDTKAWVRFRYPRWMFAGPTLCGVPVEVSRGFLDGWYAHNGVSLGNPRLGFVCVSEDMTGEFGLCGYFKEFDHDLAEDERLQFARDERPPEFDPAAQPEPPAEQWGLERLAKANRNYAVEYIRNGLTELVSVIGENGTLELGSAAARLIGLQYQREVSTILGRDADANEPHEYLARLFRGMGDAVDVSVDGDVAVLTTGAPRIVRGMGEGDARVLLTCWSELWRGALRAGRTLYQLDVRFDREHAQWRVSPE